MKRLCAILLISQFCIVSVYGYDFSVWQSTIINRPCQCHGDADGLKAGLFWVHTPDLAIIIAVYTTPGGDWPAVWPTSINYDPRADFDRNFRVDDGDNNIIETWFDKSNVPTDCDKKLSFQSLSTQNLLSNTYQTINWTWRIYTQYIPLPGPGLTDCPGALSLYYSINNGTNWTFIATVSSGTHYDWLVPVADSNNCKLKIVDNGHTGLQDITTTFKIHQCRQILTGDINADCYVNIYDMAEMAGYWLGVCSEANGWCDGADFDMSTIVNFIDYAMFARNWQLCSNPYDSNCTQ
jgi:hypothetical protein